MMMMIIIMINDDDADKSNNFCSEASYSALHIICIVRTGKCVIQNERLCYMFEGSGLIATAAPL